MDKRCWWNCAARRCMPLALAVVLAAGGVSAPSAVLAAEHGAHIGEDVSAAVKDPSEVRTDLAIFSFVIFVLLLAILRKFAWKPIVAGLEKREHTIHEHLESAKQSHEEAKKMLADYERKLAAAQDQVRAILDEARRDAEHTSQEILARAKSDAELEASRAKREIEAATGAALKTLAEHHAEQVVGLTRRLLAEVLTTPDQLRQIDVAVGKFPELGAGRN